MMNQPSDPIRSVVDGRDVWVFDNGKTLPVVSGGADEGGGGDAPAAPAETSTAPAETAPPAASASAPAAAPVEADPFDGDLGDEQVFSRGYVEKLRKQGQTYREQAQAHEQSLAEYENVYGQYDPEDRQAWFQMASEWARDPRAGAEMMSRIADAVLNDGKTPEEATEQVIAEDTVAAQAEQQGVNLTPEQVQAMVDERLAAQEAERAQEQAIQQVFEELRAAGFDPQSGDGHKVLWIANHETGGDIAKAIEVVKAERQQIIDDFVAGKSQPAPRTAPSDGMLATEAPTFHNLDDAFKAANRFIEGQQLQPG